MENGNYFFYGKKEVDFLKARDKKLAEVIDRVGWIQREVTPDLFYALMHTIVGQQISTKAHQTVWNRVVSRLQHVTPQSIRAISIAELQPLGLSFRKVEYMKTIASKVETSELDLGALHDMEDELVCAELTKIKGIGKWTAEMLMLFSMQRKNILSYGDLAIQRGLRMLYHHRTITPALHQKYWRRYSPYASVASLYIWAVAGGLVPDMKDYAPKKKSC